MTDRTTRLVLTRRVSESIQIGDDVRITVARVDQKQVRLLIEAPESVQIWRSELKERSNDVD